jgi:hypothetical protein
LICNQQAFILTGVSMSYNVIKSIFDSDELSPTERLVMLYLAINAYEGNVGSYHSQRQVATACSLSRGTINRTIKKLRQKRWVEFKYPHYLKPHNNRVETDKIKDMLLMERGFNCERCDVKRIRLSLTTKYRYGKEDQMMSTICNSFVRLVIP